MMATASAMRRAVAWARGSTIRHDLSAYRARLEQVDRYTLEVGTASDARLAHRADRLRARVREGTALDEVAEEWFALVREVARRVVGMRPFDEQMIAGLALHEGTVVEMETGEGKTLAAVAPVALNALSGDGAHVLTANDYLARRDAGWMGPIYEGLGLSVDVVQEGMGAPERRAAYQCDVTYLTAKEAGFDLLRDGLALDPGQVSHRSLQFALVDEADSLLVDEARIPLVIAGTVDEPGPDAAQMAAMVRDLRVGTEIERDEHGRNVFLTDVGIDRVQARLGVGALHESGNMSLLADVQNALHAEFLLTRDVDYIVRRGAVELVDDFTGRVAERRQWPDGLQGAIEAKEGLRVAREGRILDSITVQHFLRSYPRLCGMTATAQPAAEELADFYGLGVVVIPTHRPCRRVDHEDLIFTHRDAKETAVVDEIRRARARGRPVLVGTASVAESERLAGQVRAAGVPCRVLNAKEDELEADIVAEAGALGAVTISTNMAGRGTDIRLGGRRDQRRDEVVALGGLAVLGTNRHESFRVDSQLRGRAGRQGDPGTSQFFVSLEDPLIERFGVRSVLGTEVLPEPRSDAMDDPVMRREIDRAQRISAGQNLDMRRRLWKYAALAESQRREIREMRRQALGEATGLDLLERRCGARYEDARSRLGAVELRAIERRLTLLVIDRHWSDHVAFLRWLRDAVQALTLSADVHPWEPGRDPLTEFYRRAGQAFDALPAQIDEDVVAAFERITITEQGVDWEGEGLAGPSSTWTYLVDDPAAGAGVISGLAGSPAANQHIGGLILAPLVLLVRLAERWRRRRAA